MGWLYLLLGLGGVGAAVYMQKPPRFLGDRARTGDQALVSADVLRAMGPNTLPAALGNLGIGSVAIRVDKGDVDFVDGPIVGYTLPGQAAGPVQPIAATAPVHLPRQAVTGLLRGGVPA